MSWFFEVVNKYAVFSGRARRAEYWMFILTYSIAYLVLFGIDYAAGFTARGEYGILSGIFGLALLLPAWGVAVRRLHDTNRSGWWLLINLIPLAAIIMLIWLCQDGTPGENRYGADPKGPTVAREASSWSSPSGSQLTMMGAAGAVTALGVVGILSLVA